MSNHDIYIPSHWSGEEALAVAGMLQQLVDAIWDGHAYKMGNALEQRCRDGLEPALNADADTDTDSSLEVR